jgi:hypothetical protein
MLTVAFATGVVLPSRVTVTVALQVKRLFVEGVGPVMLADEMFICGGGGLQESIVAAAAAAAAESIDCWTCTAVQ